MSVDALPFLAAIDQDARRALVRDHPGLDGIDFVEVLSNHAGSVGEVPGAPAQRMLVVHLLNGPVPGDWTAARVVVLGGVRQDPELNPVQVAWAYPAVALAGVAGNPPVDPLEGVTAADRQLVGQALPADAERTRALVVRTLSSGDWSVYTLRLVGAPGEAAPAGIDVPLATMPFTFTVDCPSELDCREPDAAVAQAESLLPIDYLARDYDALRTRLLDRLATVLPEWTDRSPADPGVMLVELFAAVGDRLAYWQDAVAAEAYLSRARRRTSVRRHARLLDYAVHEGCSARTLVAFMTDSDLVVPAGTPVTDLEPDPRVGGSVLGVDAADLGGTVFETRTPVAIAPERNALPLYAWGDPDHCLAAGATAAFVSTATGVDPGLRAGDLVVLADQPVNGVAREGDPARRYAVRLSEDPRLHHDPVEPGRDVWELRWVSSDALTGCLQVTTPGTTDARAVALGNIALADHGATVLDEALVPAAVADDGSFHPRLARPGLAFVDDGVGGDGARDLLVPDPRRAVAAARLDDGQRVWMPRSDLLASGRLATHFVVEPESGGVSRLRFGDGVHGRAPAVRAAPRATYRIGGGAVGNVAADRLVRLLPLPDGSSPIGAGARVSVWNPLPAAGGIDPEALEQVRQLAPSAFRFQLRAVTSPDYAAVAERNPGVQRAVARRRWAGSWYVQEVTADPVAARSQDSSLADELSAELEIRRMAGLDVELARPVYVPLHVVVSGCVLPDHHRADVEARLREVFSTGVLPDGRLGFFHPDRYTFGQSLLLSDVVAAAMGVDGLAWVELTRFARMGASPRVAAESLRAGELTMAAREVLRCDSDVNNPEDGRLDVVLGGGS